MRCTIINAISHQTGTFFSRAAKYMSSALNQAHVFCAIWRSIVRSKRVGRRSKSSRRSDRSWESAKGSRKCARPPSADTTAPPAESGPPSGDQGTETRLAELLSIVGITNTRRCSASGIAPSSWRSTVARSCWNVGATAPAWSATSSLCASPAARACCAASCASGEGGGNRCRIQASGTVSP